MTATVILLAKIQELNLDAFSVTRNDDIVTDTFEEDGDSKQYLKR